MVVRFRLWRTKAGPRGTSLLHLLKVASLTEYLGGYRSAPPIDIYPGNGLAGLNHQPNPPHSHDVPEPIGTMGNR